MTTFNGTLTITIGECTLSLPQHLSKQDLYCVVTLGSSGLKNLLEGERLGKERFQTKVHNGAGQHAAWNETHVLSLKNMKLDSHLKVKLYDKDVVKDDFLSEAKITLQELLKYDRKGVQYFPLFKKGAVRQDTSEAIGQIGVGVAFNCTEIPQAQADLKSQIKEAVTRKDQAPLGVLGPLQQAHESHLQGSQQQIPSTYQGPVQKVLPPSSEAAHSDEMRTDVVQPVGESMPQTGGIQPMTRQPMTQTSKTPPMTQTGVTQPMTQTSGTQPMTQTGVTQPMTQTGITHPKTETVTQPISQTGQFQGTR